MDKDVMIIVRAQQYAEVLTEKLHAEWEHAVRNGEHFSLAKAKHGMKYVRVLSGSSVHAFVDLANGDVMKPASWAGPVKNAAGKTRPSYNLLDDESFADLILDCEFTGGYLYANAQKRKAAGVR